MESLYNKEKKLETVLEKLKNLSGSPSVYGGELEQLYDEAYDLYMEWNEWVEEANPSILVLDEYEKK